MKLNSTTLVGLLVLSSSLMLQALSPVQIRKLVDEGQTAIRKGDTKTAQRKIHELKISGNSAAAVPLERELLEGSLSQLKYTKDSLTKARERLAEASKGGRANKKEITDQEKRINELENLLLDTARETSDLEELFRTAIKELEVARAELESSKKPAPYSAGVEPADDNVVRTAKTALDKDLRRVIGHTDVHNLNQIEKAADFTYFDYLYWRRSIGWNAYMTLLYWKNNKLYNELTTKYKDYSVRFDQEKDQGSRVFKEAAMSYLADLDASGIGKYSARQILPKDELWKYLRAEQEVAKYIDAVRKINPKKADEVVAIAKKYREEVEAEETKAREERDKAHAEMAAEEAAKHSKEEVQETKKEVENTFGSTLAERYEEAGAPA